eukprot:scaffold76056_cov27-Tisochrysis_lutea.AAC.2
MLVNSANAGHGPVGRRDDDAVARVELLWKLAIEAHLERWGGVAGRARTCADDCRLCAGSWALTTTESGKTVGRKESEWGQIGVSKMAGFEGAMRGPPAARE